MRPINHLPRVVLCFSLACKITCQASETSPPSPVNSVQVLGEMKRMFLAHDIGANVDLSQFNKIPHLYALGPMAGLKGEITVLDGQVFASTVGTAGPDVAVSPTVKAVFLVYTSVPDWKSISLPKNVISEEDLANFLEAKFAGQSRSPFLVKGIARQVRYHVQNFQGAAETLTHESHDQSKVFYEASDKPVELVGFFSNRAEDGGLFVHRGQTTHIHMISQDRKDMGHVETLMLEPGAQLLLPARADSPKQ